MTISLPPQPGAAPTPADGDGRGPDAGPEPDRAFEPDTEVNAADPTSKDAATLDVVGSTPAREPPRTGTAAAVEAAAGTVERLGIGRSVELAPDDPWAEAGRAVLRFHLGRMLARTAGVIEGVDPEEVHAMRVAGRRMRAAWRVFGDAYDAATVRRFRRDLRDVGRRLGAVRDLDVLIGILESERGRRPERERAALAPLLASWQLERQARRAELIETLGSTAFLEFVNEYETFVVTPGLAARPIAPDGPGQVRHRMPAVIWTEYAAVWAYDPHFAGADIATLHGARIAGKWLRYALEFVRPPLEPDATALVRRIVAVQDHLGDLHDLHVAAELSRTFAADPHLGLTKGQRAAVGRFVSHLDRRVERLRRTAGPTWREVTDPAYRRSLGRALARL